MHIFLVLTGLLFWVLAAFLLRLSCRVLKTQQPWMRILAPVTLIGLILAACVMGIIACLLTSSPVDARPETWLYATGTLFLGGVFTLLLSTAFVGRLLNRKSLPTTERVDADREIGEKQ